MVIDKKDTLHKSNYIRQIADETEDFLGLTERNFSQEQHDEVIKRMEELFETAYIFTGRQARYDIVLQCVQIIDDVLEEEQVNGYMG